MFHDTYDPFDSQKHKPPPPVSSTSFNSLPSPQNLSSSLVTHQILHSPSSPPHTHFFTPDDTPSSPAPASSTIPKSEMLRSQRKWKRFEDDVRSTLHWQSTAKHPTGPSTHLLTKQLAKLMFPVEKKDLETSQFLHSHHSSQEVFQTIASHPSLLTLQSSASLPHPLENEASLSPSLQQETRPSLSRSSERSKKQKLKPISGASRSSCQSR
jgi:hypothetical protein